MEDALEPLDEAEYTFRPNRQFILGLAASLLLHLALAAFILGVPAGGGKPPRPAVTYVDLKSIPAPTPPAPVVPQQLKPEPEPEPVSAKDEVKPLPETHPRQEARPAPQPPAPATQPAPPQAAEEERSATTFGMGLTKGFFKPLSDGDSLRPEIKEYYLNILQGINEKWWLEQKDNKVRPIVVNLVVARDGRIIGSNIMASSGNIVYDRAVQKMLESAGPLPPVPPEYMGEVFMAPIRLVPPLNLMSW